MFPLIGAASALPPPAPRTARVLSAYARHRRRLNAMGVTVGKARLAFDAPRCVRCGLCMTGCPYGLIYSAAQTFDRLRREGRVVYHDGLLATRVHEQDGRPSVVAKELATGQLHRFDADRIYVACGAVGTTRLIAASLGRFGQEFAMAESQQFTLPLVSVVPVADPRRTPQFTLNQFNIVVQLDEAGLDVSQLHVYTYDPSFIGAMPGLLRRRGGGPAMAQLLRRTSVAIGYLPSWHSPSLRVRIGSAPAEDALPDVRVDRETTHWLGNRTLRDVLGKVVRAAPVLDLYPVLPRIVMSAGGKSYHWGASFPHARDGRSAQESDRLGRVGSWERVHLVDASVFPSVTATTHTLTVMANAHRIADESMRTSS